MGTGKALLVVCVMGLSVFVLSQVSHGLGFNVNLETPAPTETGKAAKVEGAVGDAANKGPNLPSNPNVTAANVDQEDTGTKLASGQTLAQARPDLAEDMKKFLPIPAIIIQSF